MGKRNVSHRRITIKVHNETQADIAETIFGAVGRFMEHMKVGANETPDYHAVQDEILNALRQSRKIGNQYHKEAERGRRVEG